MTQTKLRILHETNPRKYFPALFELAEQGRVDLVGEHRYSVVKEWLRAGLKDRTPWQVRTKNAFKDLLFRLSIPFVRGEVILFGFAPWDWRILIYQWLAKHNRIVYHTSWHDWRLNKTPRQPPTHWLKTYLQKRWFKFVQHPNVNVVAITSVVGDAVEKETGVAPTIIPHAVPETFFQARQRRSENNSVSATNTLKLLFVGELSEKKGLKTLFTLMDRLPKGMASLTIVGSGPLENQIPDSHPNIHYLGPIYDRDKLAGVMADHDVLMLLSQKTASWEELFGIVIVEAIAAGCAVIASDHVGPKEIFKHQQDVGLFAETDLEGIEKTLLALYQNQQQLTALFERQNVAQDYSITQLKSAWLHVVESQ